MKEVSDRTLMVLILAAVFISLSGTFFSLTRLDGIMAPGITGAAVNGLTNYSINSVTSIAVYGNINFGSGYANTSTAWLFGNSTDHLPKNGSGTWDWTGSGLLYIRVVNDGNSNVSLNVSANNSASTFIGGTNPFYNISITFEENGSTDLMRGGWGSCYANITSGDVQQKEWTTINNSRNVTLCTNLSYFNDYDEINVSIALGVPDDAVIEYKASLLTFFGEAK